MDNMIFERHEIKFLVGDRQRRALEESIQTQMQPDPHGESTICNIYYDTPDFHLIRRSLEKPVYKEKLRLRSYGPAAPEQEVFLELKKKYKDVVYKRRLCTGQREAVDFLRGKAPLPEESQISHEIGYALTFYRGLAPAMYLCYDRSAFFGREDHSLRVTFDENIRWRTEDLSLSARPGGRLLLIPGQSLMEIKTPGAVPMWLVQLLNEGGVRRCSFSKYGRAYESMLQNQSHESRGVFCA